MRAKTSVLWIRWHTPTTGMAVNEPPLNGCNCFGVGRFMVLSDCGLQVDPLAHLARGLIIAKIELTQVAATLFSMAILLFLVKMWPILVLMPVVC